VLITSSANAREPGELRVQAEDDLAIPGLTLPEFILARGQGRNQRPALVDATTGRVVTYDELAIDVQRVGAGLAAHGVQPGDVVALCAANSIEFVVTWYAASAIGAIVTTLNPVLTSEEMTQLLRQVGARWLVTSAELFEAKLRDCASAAGVRHSVVFGPMDRQPEGVFPFESLYETVPDVAVAGAGHRDVAFMPFSSGTSGFPKSVVLTHRNLVASLCQMLPVHGVRADDVVVAVLPLYHLFAFQVTLNLSLAQGATVVLLRRYELDAFLSTVQNFSVTRAEVVPPILFALATSDRVEEFDLSSLRVLMVGAAPTDEKLARACAARLGCRVKQGYGMTELGGCSHIAPDEGPDKPDSIGPMLPGVDCRVIDTATGADVGHGEPGELLVRCAAATDRYLDNPTATEATIDGQGWLHTGDIVTVDEEGWFRVTGRIKELIKYKGFQVAPAELEGLLLTHPAVADVAVVPSLDEIAGEVPKAFVVLGGAASAEELMGWVGERVAPYKRVRRLEFVDEIPRSPAGKILRRILVDRECVEHERFPGRATLSGDRRGD
jgi:acyl-CoA synthetase (AMP-forming)/AMP-acid ligase II